MATPKDTGWIPAKAVRIVNGKAHILTPANSGRVPNISQGFYDGMGRFHPIRAASDYDTYLGDPYSSRSTKPRKKAKKRVAAKKRATAKKRKR